VGTPGSREPSQKDEPTGAGVAPRAAEHRSYLLGLCVVVFLIVRVGRGPRRGVFP
jgi:hypothetical protein